MNNLIFISSAYWTAVYFFLSALAIYGYLKFENQKGDLKTGAVKYAAIIVGASALLHLIQKLGKFAASGASWADFVYDANNAAQSLFDICLHLIFVILLFCLTALYRSKKLRLFTFIVSVIFIFSIVGKALQGTPAANQNEKPETDFPAGEKRDYLQEFLTKNNYQFTLKIKETDIANAWVKDNFDDKSVYFTRPAFNALSKEQLKAVMMHEFAHKYYPSSEKILRSNLKTWIRALFYVAIILLISALFISSLSGLSGFTLKRNNTRKNNRHYLRLKQKSIPRIIVFVVLITVLLSLPGVAFENYIRRIEERHADSVALKLMRENNLPSIRLIEALLKVENADDLYNESSDRNWLYYSLFATHPSPGERIAEIRRRD